MSRSSSVAADPVSRPADPAPPAGSLLAELRHRARAEPMTSRSRPPAPAGAAAPQAAARERELGRHGRRTVRKLLEAGLAELADKGYQALRVDDVAQRAGISHGTFYLYFASKEDMFSALAREVLQDMRAIAGDFPVVTPDSAGQAALRDWVASFGRLYMAHATIIRILSQAEVVGEAIWADGMRVLFGLGQAIAQGMTAARSRRAAGGFDSRCSQRDELTALACLTLLERVNYLFAMGVRLPRDEMTSRLSDIIYAAFRPVQAGEGASASSRLGKTGST